MPVKVRDLIGMLEADGWALVTTKGSHRQYKPAYVPDLPGCIATGDTVAEVEANIREAIMFHLEGMRQDGVPVPPGSSQVEYVDVVA